MRGVANGQQTEVYSYHKTAKEVLEALHRRSESFELRGLVACLLECEHLAG